MALTLPTRVGYMVEWYTGKVWERKLKKGGTEAIRLTDSFASKSRERVEAKKAELEKEGLEVIGIYECIF